MARISIGTPSWPAVGEVRPDLLDKEQQASAPRDSGIKQMPDSITPVRALLMGYYGVGNLGDEMMLFCLKPWLEQQGFELTVLSERPAEV